MPRAHFKFPYLAGVFVLLAPLFACTQSGSPEFKEISYPLNTDIQGFDPIHVRDAYSHAAVAQVYQGLLQYKYLARPYGVEPLLASEMPEVSVDGLTYTFKLREGVFFTDDPAFRGNPRPLRSSDFVYSFMRLADPANQSPSWWLLEDRIVGLDEFREALKSARPAEPYDLKVQGLVTPDERTLMVRLKKPYRQFPFVLAMPALTVVAHEVVDKYGREFLNHPVGTGPFVFKEWRRGQKISFERNRAYWRETYPSEGAPEDRAQGLLTAAGKFLPFADRVTFWIYVETQPLWLNFLKGNLDLGVIPKDAFDSVFDGRRQLRRGMTDKGIVSGLGKQADLVMFVFNMDDPLLGKNRFLRQAISAAIDRQAMIHTFFNDRALIAQGPIPPDIFGYDPNRKDPNGYDPARAKELMKKALEFEKARGRAAIPPIVHDIHNSTSARQVAEALVNDLKKIGLTLKIRVSTWPQLQERMARGDIQLTFYSWVADYPDPENFLRLLYSKNVSPGPNTANFRNAEYDRMFERMRDLPNNAERSELISGMVRLVQEETPWVFFNHRLAYPIRHDWVKNFKRNEMAPAQLKYLDIDLKRKQEALKKL